MELGVNYERTITQNWGGAVAFSVWIPSSIDYVDHGWKNPNDRYSAGPVSTIVHYKTLDLSVFYRLLKRKKHHITVDLGPSFCWAANAYSDTPYQFSGRPVAG